MCKTKVSDAVMYYSPELIDTAKRMLPKAYEHHLEWWDGELRYDGKRVRVVTNHRGQYIQVGCTRISFEAIQLLESWCRSKDETVIQTEQLLPVDDGKIIITSTGPG